ncbi:hypothetical protein [Ferruginibacter albus]|uniref:hypothetical protein n=1 Tax=Ferruginibacter albus TaxID=2875540 RepID=UPI001CC376A9|nr:hypothetical protein [Ferruginibacter albus]UAY52332.1 hypothetical protein K9M53_01240 [Ferruginibacter albus]
MKTLINKHGQKACMALLLTIIAQATFAASENMIATESNGVTQTVVLFLVFVACILLPLFTPRKTIGNK